MLQPNFISPWRSTTSIREAVDPWESSIQEGTRDLHITAGERFGVEHLPFLRVDVLFRDADIETAFVVLFEEGSRRPDSLKYGPLNRNIC